MSVSKTSQFNFIKIQLRDKGKMKKTWVWRYDKVFLKPAYQGKFLMRLEGRRQGQE